MVKRVCIYIDGANFYGGLTSLNKNFSDLNFDFENYIKFLCKQDKLVKIYYYNAHVKKKINDKIWAKQKIYLIDCTKFLNVKLVYVQENLV
ncbi:hypothetical protein CMI37_17340 [Candidatus Pacearchaeota archaeon]|nr:hypothetical protein [Candidatus Pacearchaeota archaeon]